MIDIGANLCHDSFDSDRETVLERAKSAGIKKVVVTGSCLASSAAAIALAQQHPGYLYATAGVHPHHADHITQQSLQQLHAYGAQPEVVATGEMGLDFFRDLCPRAVQEAAFQQQLEWAVEVGKPVFLHQRDAHDRFLPILKDYLPHLPAVVVHCFTGSAADLHDYINLDLHIGITGWFCDERRGKHLWPLINDIPSNRLMVETDAPYLLPRTISPKPDSRRNEPMHLGKVIETIANLLNRPVETVAQQTENTAIRFFDL